MEVREAPDPLWLVALAGGVVAVVLDRILPDVRFGHS